MYEKIEWSRNPGNFKEWEFCDVQEGPLHDALCGILEERMNVIFGGNGVRPVIYAMFDDDGNPTLSLLISDDSDDPLAQVDFTLEKILSEFITDACAYSEEAPVALKLALEKALSDLDKIHPTP